jgi:hypothetical protein
MANTLYASIALTMADECVSFLENQQAMAMDNRAAPASLATKTPPGSVSAVPSNPSATEAGTIARAKPVSASMIAVAVRSDFIWFKVNSAGFEKQTILEFPAGGATFLSA